jgi:hypothetical protein
MALSVMLLMQALAQVMDVARIKSITQRAVYIIVA